MTTADGERKHPVLLQTTELTKRFGGVTALEGISLSIEAGKISSLIGPNGAGKTTFFNCIAGLIPETSGTAFFQGIPLCRFKPYQIARKGMARTFQNVRLFSAMTVIENVMIGRYMRSVLPAARAFWQALLRGKAFASQERALREEAMALLDFVGLVGQWDGPAHSLAYGHQRRLEIARALASEPLLLLLDEPAAGMNPKEAEALMRLIEKIRTRGVTPLLIEHNMKVVMGISDRVIVLDHGMKIAEGTAWHVREDPKVIEAYLGRRADVSVAVPRDR